MTFQSLKSPTGVPGFALPGVRMRGVVSALPAGRLDNADFAPRFGEDVVRDVSRMIGVETRYWVSPGQTTSDLCLAGGERLLERLAWPRASVDALIFVSQTPDQRLPATACVLHGRLGLAPHCQAFDVGLGCSGYVYGLWLASTLIAAGCGRVLLMAGDTISPIVDPDDRGTALLFGDAGTATALEHDDAAPVTTFVLGTDGAGASNLIVPAGGFREPAEDPRRTRPFNPEHLYMDGGEVFAFTLRAVPKLVAETLAHAGCTAQEVDAFVLHQANRFMLNHLAKKIGARPEQAPINIDRFGNTSSATLPLVLTTDLAKRITSAPAKIALVGFGVGYSWGAALMQTDPLAAAETLYL